MTKWADVTLRVRDQDGTAASIKARIDSDLAVRLVEEVQANAVERIHRAKRPSTLDEVEGARTTRIDSEPQAETPGPKAPGWCGASE